jgi:type IV pilus assembly protein PilC
MEIYAYIAKDESSNTIKGSVEARDEHHAAEILRAKKLVPISFKAKSASQFSSLEKFKNRITSRDTMVFTQQLATMLTTGLSLTAALNVLQMQSRTAMSKVIGEVQHDVEGGTSLAESLAKHPDVFSGVYIALVKAGEAAGKLDSVLQRLADTEEKRREFQSKIKGAMIYPIIILLAMIVVVIIMMVFVIPQLTEIYEDLGAELPLLTRIMIAVSKGMITFWWAIVAIVGGGIVTIKRWAATSRGMHAINEQILHLPMIGNIVMQVAMTEFTRTLSLLISAGISILEALTIVAKTSGNTVIRNALTKASLSVEKGVPLAASLASQQIFPPVMAQMVSVGEETGKLDDVLNKVSHYFESESEHQLKNLTAAFEPLIMVIMGVGVAIIVFAVIMPIYNLTDQF